jgi:hypothetical protein
MTNEEPLMDDEQAGDAVAKYLEENPELLQGIVPEHDLWPVIESRISAHVIPMSARPARAGRKSFGWVPMLIAASALVAASAGVTYVLTTRSAVSSGAVASNVTRTQSVTPAITDTQSHVAQNVAQQGAPNGTIPVTQSQAGSVATDVAAHVAEDSPTVPQQSRPTMQLASRNGNNEGDVMRQTYDSEITTLRAALDSRRGQLNPSTVAVIEQNLRVIDEAIRQSRAALAKDPNSSLLNDQLDRTLAKKTGLLRAAALLPSA